MSQFIQTHPISLRSNQISLGLKSGVCPWRGMNPGHATVNRQRRAMNLDLSHKHYFYRLQTDYVSKAVLFTISLVLYCSDTLCIFKTCMYKQRTLQLIKLLLNKDQFRQLKDAMTSYILVPQGQATTAEKSYEVILFNLSHLLFIKCADRNCDYAAPDNWSIRGL